MELVLPSTQYKNSFIEAVKNINKNEIVGYYLIYV